MMKPSSRYTSSSSDHHSSPSPSSSSSSSRLRKAIMDPIAGVPIGNSSRAMVRARTGGGNENDLNLGSMLRKLLEKKPSRRKNSIDPITVAVPKETGKGKGKGNGTTNFSSALSRKLFQKCTTTNNYSSASADKAALTEVKSNTRTLAMVLRSERELLSQNKDYQEEISELRLLLQERNREVEKLKDMCLKQREEIKALKDAILFPDVMDTRLQELLEKQGSELKQANQVIPTLQRQVSSLTGQLQCLAEDLAEVKANKRGARTHIDREMSYSSPRTPILHQNSPPFPALEEHSSTGDGATTEYGIGSPDEMFLEDVNPCLTPRFSKNKFQECDGELGCESPKGDMFSLLCGGLKSKSSEHHQQRPTSSGKYSAHKIYKSEEDKWCAANNKSGYPNYF